MASNPSFFSLPHRGPAEYLGHQFAAGPELLDFFDQLDDGDVAVFRRGQTITVPQRQQVVVDAADPLGCIPQADRHTRTEHRGHHMRGPVGKERSRIEVVATRSQSSLSGGRGAKGRSELFRVIPLIEQKEVRVTGLHADVHGRARQLQHEAAPLSGTAVDIEGATEQFGQRPADA